MVNEKTKKTVLNISGVLFLSLGILAIFNAAVILDDPEHILWFSYIILVLIGVGILTRNSFLIAACLNIIAIPYIFWTVDFLYILIMGKGFLGITDYFFMPGPLLGKIITSQHLFSVPLAVFGLFLIKLKRKDAWKLSFAILIVVYLLTIFLTSSESNINCTFETCMYPDFKFGFYPLAWFIANFVMIIITNLVLTRLKFLFPSTGLNTPRLCLSCRSQL